jgi:hypothetical protein
VAATDVSSGLLERSYALERSNFDCFGAAYVSNEHSVAS